MAQHEAVRRRTRKSRATGILCFSDRSPRQLSVPIRVLQNWQSAFLSTAVLVTLSIFPRVRGSSFCPRNGA
ncbi:DUF6766 family protein (plasmid) [Ensifer adhaerens]